MKKIILTGMLVFLMLFLVGCNEEVKTEETSSEVEETSAGNEQWPENELTSLIPKPEFGDLNAH
jgi:PBP1b-binding outer membrane lipoprotein LpoB